MRDLINLLDSIVESRGLSARKPGEVYSRGDTADDKIVFKPAGAKEKSFFQVNRDHRDKHEDHQRNNSDACAKAYYKACATD